MVEWLKYNPTPVQEIRHEILSRHGVQLLVKREDLNHPSVSGNKWWKLKYNFLKAAELGFRKVLTFGGAYSNHIYSTSAAAAFLDFSSVGIIRGERALPLNATLSFAAEKGMNLYFVSRDEYRRKGERQFLDILKDRFGDFYLIPEGGTNDLAIRGCEELGRNLQDIRFDKLMLAIGTGGTIAGLISAFHGTKEIIGVPVLKNADFLSEEIERLVFNYSGGRLGNFRLLTNYHQGGYAKVNIPLINFIKEMRSICGLPLDPVYTGKLVMAIFEEVRNGNFKRGTTILALHSGGLQGAAEIHA
jgi:1-aminocyclopropane-1-carboxylate deaminase